MAIPKVMGIETEYGIVVTGAPDMNPIQSSSLLVNSFVQSLGRAPSAKVSWNFDDEMPGNDARGWAVGGAMPPEVETHLVNAVLTNGARFYVDHAHPEYSSPECRDALSATLFDLAGERVLLAAMAEASKLLPGKQEVVVYKNNSDGKGNSYGTHENYLMDRRLPFIDVVTNLMPFFVTRQIFCGAGKVGCELPGVHDVPFQITQRADFFEEVVGLETTLKRPIINTRDEPHSDSQRYRRLHVIVGDANMSQGATFLKLGATAIILSMVEDGVLKGKNFAMVDPVRSLRAVSQDPSLRQTVELYDGRSATALDLQWEYLHLAQGWAASRGLESVGDEVGRTALERWESVLTGLESDPVSVADTVDWVAKKRLIDGFRDRHRCEPDDARLRVIDLQYHDLRPAKSLAARAGLAILFDEAAIAAAVTEPPGDTRAYFRGRCLQKYSSFIAAANWDSIVFDLGVDPLRRVPMMEPLRGTKAMVGDLIDSCATPAELLAKLGA